jgi:Glycosyl transferases group 1
MTIRIFLSCLQSQKRYQVPAYDFWRTYFVKGLQEAGYEIVEAPGVDWAEGLVYSDGAALDAWRARTWESVYSFIRKEHAHRPIKLFLSYLFPKQVEVSAIKELQRMGVQCVNFFCDNVREFRRVPVEYFPFALHWVPEFEAVRMYQAAKLPYLHAPMPCWVPPALRNPPINEVEPPTFIGSADILRRNLVGRALQMGANLLVGGSGWAMEKDDATVGVTKKRSVSVIVANQLASVRNQGFWSLLYKAENYIHPMYAPPVPTANIRDALIGTEEYFRLTREATVTVGINRVPNLRASNYRPIVYSRLRDIEAPMLGACYLTEWTSGLDRMYELGTEIETYRTAQELNSKLADLTKNHERRFTMRKRAQQRALRDHSVAHSVMRIRSQLGL